jgi:hypothetical protein
MVLHAVRTATPQASEMAASTFKMILLSRIVVLLDRSPWSGRIINGRW